MGVRSLGYLRLESNDLDRWKTFGADFLGLMPVEGGDSESLSFRMDDYPARIVVSPGARSGMTALGFEVLDERELARLVADVEKAGIKVTAGTEAEAAERKVTGFVGFNDPGGNPVELFYGTVLDHVPVRTPLVSKFVTGDMGFGHAIVSAEDARATFDFYVGVLGFIERNTMSSPRRRPGSWGATHGTTRSVSPPCRVPGGCCTSWSRGRHWTTSGAPSTGPPSTRCR